VTSDESRIENATRSSEAPGARGVLAFPLARHSSLVTRHWVILLLLPFGLAAGVYYPIVHNYFWFDDFLNLYRIANAPVIEYLLTPHGGHALLLRNLLFYLCERAFGTEPAGYFWVVLITHLVNVALLFAVASRLTQSAGVACFAALLWGTSPVLEAALGWYSVYGHVAATTVMLVILLLILRVAEEPARARRSLRACYVLALAGVTLFGVGIGIALALPFATALLAPGARPSGRWRLPLQSLFLTVPALYLGLFWLNGAFFGEGIETPGQLAEYLVRFWPSLFSTILHLMGWGLLRLLLGFWFVPALGTEAVYGPLLAFFLLAALVVMLRAPAPVRRQLAACFAFALGCYGLIASGRVALFTADSGFVTTQARYQYAGLAPLSVILCLLVNHARLAWRLPSRTATGLFFVWLVVAGSGYARSDFRIDHHDRARHQTRYVLDLIRSQVDATPIGQDVYIRNRPFAGLPGIVPMTQFPGHAGVFVIFHPQNRVDGRPVYFTERRSEVVAASRRGKRSAGLIVPYEP
jgi:hypothetical protein